jgi:predicted transposase/invertase (TIGR01784 family)
MNTDLYHSHDKLFRETWSDLASARSFLQNYLPGKVLDVARLDTLEICKDSFIEPDLKDYYSDMLYRVEFGESPGYIYFLFEHKSFPDRNIHLQLLEYMVKIWRLGQKQGGFGKLSIVVPLVLYHGRSKWRINENFLSGFNGPVESLVEYIPDFRYVLYDLSEYSDDEIKGTVMARVTMLLLKHVFEPDLADRLPNIFSLLKELSKKKTGLQYFESLVKYVFSHVDDITVDKMQAIVHNALLEDKGEYIVTLAEKLRKQGLEQGLEQGLFEAVELGISIKFEDTEETRAIIEKIKKVKNIGLLKALKESLKTANSPSDLVRIIDN